MSKNIYNSGVSDPEDDDVLKVTIWCVPLTGLYKICKERYTKIAGHYMDLVPERPTNKSRNEILMGMLNHFAKEDCTKPLWIKLYEVCTCIILILKI